MSSYIGLMRVGAVQVVVDPEEFLLGLGLPLDREVLVAQELPQNLFSRADQLGGQFLGFRHCHCLQMQMHLTSASANAARSRSQSLAAAGGRCSAELDAMLSDDRARSEHLTP